MAAEFQSAKVVVSIETIIKNLERDSKRLEGLRRTLLSIASIKLGGKTVATGSFDKAAASAQKLLIQQQKIAIQTQELANRQEKARQTAVRLAQSAERLAQAQERLAKAQERVNKASGKPKVTSGPKLPQQDAHVLAFRALEKQRKQLEREEERERKRQQSAADSLQKQRSTALTRDFVSQERAQERARRSVLSLDRALGKAGGTLRNLGQGLVSFGTSLSIALTAPLTALGILATRNAVTLDSLKRGLTAIVGSASEAGEQLGRLTEIAKLPGIGFQEAIQGSIRLQAVGFSAEVAEKALIQFSNAVALTGGGREELNRITVQLGQLSAKGRVLSQDLRPIIEAGPAVGKALKEAFGTVNAEDIQALGLTSEQFIDRLVKQLEQLPRAATGARNSLENFSDAIFRSSAAIGDAILPILTKLIQVAEPIIIALADGFKGLPPLVQGLAVAFAGLLAVAGPTLFIFGQLVGGIGGLLTAFANLSQLGLLPTINGFRLLAQVMQGTASLAAGQAATTAAAAAGWIALGGAIAIAAAALVVIVGGLASYASAQSKAVKISDEQLRATQDQIEVLEKQLKFVDSLAEGVKRTADEQERLADIYASLNTQAKIRITAITDEEKRLAELRQQLEAILRLRREEQIQQAANLTASLAGTAQQLQANENERQSITARVTANAELSQAIQESGKLTKEQTKQLARQSINARTAEEAIGALNAENETLIGSQSSLIDSAKDLNGTAKEQGAALKVLQEQTGRSARELLSAAKAMGIFKGDVEKTLPLIEEYIRLEKQATSATGDFTRSLNEQSKALLKAAEDARNDRKARKAVIESAADLAKEATDSFEGALKTLKAFIAAQPELAAAIEKERRLAGKSLEEFLNDVLREGSGKSENQLLNAQERLTKARVDLSQIEAERLATIERIKNDRLLQENENAFRLQLISYREYLNERARLTSANLSIEIGDRRREIEKLQKEEDRARERSLKPGLKAPARAQAEAVAVEAAAKRKKLEDEVLQLQARQTDARRELNQAIAEAQQQQVKDVRQLDIEFAELGGRIEDALNTATIEKFREKLSALGKEQDRITKELELARLVRDQDDIEALEKAQRLNQAQIDLIELLTQQELATNKLSAAQVFVARAQERQADLEKQITFDVENRGLKEEDAIRKRLEGEKKLADSLRVVRDLIQSVVDSLTAKGVKPPEALLQFVREVNASLRGLGELPFSEQFRLAEKEFQRLNDERLRRIQDVERAVRNRTIAEVEGQILIRQINGEYTADLERQLAILKQIAQASGQDELRRRAQDAGDVVRDTRDEVAGLGTQIESAGKDALRSGFTDFFNDILNRTSSAKEALLNFVNSIATAVNDVIAENLGKELFESLFGGKDTGGLIARIRGIFGGGADTGVVGGIATTAATGVESAAASASLTTGAAVAATALTTGGTAAGTALAAGAATASGTLVAGLTAAAASFSAAVIAAGAAFASAVGFSQSLGGVGAAFGAETGLFPAVPGGLYKFVEGGYPEAVLTTDPRHAAKQVGILRQLLQRTKGFYGRVPQFASGTFITREAAEFNLLSSINRAPQLSPSLSSSALQTAAGAGLMNLRINNMVNSRELIRPYVSSEEFTTDVMNVISKQSNEIVRRLPIRGR